MRKYILYISIIFVFTQIFAVGIKTVHAVTCDDNGLPAGCTPATTNECAPDDNGNIPEKCKSYHLLAPLPCPEGSPGCTLDQKTGGYTLTDFNPKSDDPNDNSKLGDYLNLMIKIFIGLCAVLAVLMIVIGGIEYIGSDLIFTKESGRSKMNHAILGLLLALGAYALLNTINPDILKTDFKSFTGVTVEVTDLGEISDTVSVAIQKNALQSLGITDCTGSGGKSSVTTIAQEFIGKTKYSMANRNTISGSIINLDCSSFIDQVYNCAGLSMPGITSGNITSVATSTNGKKVDGKTFDFNTLHPGDVVGWEGNGTKPYGHVAIYIGNGQLIDTNSKGNTQILPLSTYKDRITFVRWP